MEADWATIAVRFALYADMMLLFGVPLAAKLWVRVERRPGWHCGRVAASAAGAGIVLSVASLVLAVKTMAGVASYGEIDSDTVWMIATETGFGVAWQVRVFALLVCLLATLAPWFRRVRVIQFPAAAIALSTLAWGGHGVMDEGIRHTVHLSADIIHLLAAGAWVGALATFVRMSSPDCTATDDSVAELSRAANGFAHIGTGIVVALVLTGTVNYVMIAGPTLSGLLTTRYGALLLAKLALFGAMLALAAVNRYRLGPRLAHAVRTGDSRTALAALRRSLRFESGCAMLVLFLVAWLGTLSPVP
ncbi:copper homeostasis membrane protein CopD [Cupriavidus pinatubonensis]|uniref:copper homeostasis membrane protein CopD n=1 Tax=Cupriavidus pinatubonensis TaxID=248026 RepID=UPI00360E32E0